MKKEKNSVEDCSNWFRISNFISIFNTNPFNISFLEYFRLGFELLGKVFVYILDFSKAGADFYLAHF